MFRAPTGDLNAFPPRLRDYLTTTLQTMLAGVLESEDPGQLFNLTQSLEQAPRIIGNICVTSFATWALQHSDELGPQSEGVKWAVGIAEVIADLTSRTPTPSTAEVFCDPRFDQLIAEARGIFGDVPELVAAVNAKTGGRWLASLPAASEAVQ
jgi:hypothetical protein